MPKSCRAAQYAYNFENLRKLAQSTVEKTRMSKERKQEGGIEARRITIVVNRQDPSTYFLTRRWLLVEAG